MPRPNRGPSLQWKPEKGSFYIVWFENGARRIRSTSTADRRDAEKALAAFITASHLNLQGPREPSAVTVAEALQFYAQLHAGNTMDPGRIGYAISALIGFWKNSTLDKVNPVSCESYVAERGVSAGTTRRELGTLAAAINYMYKMGELTRAVPVKLPPRPAGKKRWLTLSEAAQLLNAARNADGRSRHYLPLFILIALYTGARKEAILSLTWAQIDQVGRTIDFAVPGRRVTKKVRPMLPIPNRLNLFLEYAWRRRSSDTGPVLHLDGEPLLRIDKGFRLSVERAGLVDVTPHTLRHTCGTWLAQGGVDIWKISGWLGQTTATTEGIYMHHNPKYMDDALRAIDRRRVTQPA